MTDAPALPIADAFGNPIDATVGYARGSILRGTADEVQRMMHGRALVRTRASRLGVGAVYNLTGVTRNFPLSEGDYEYIRTQVGFYTTFSGRAEEVGLRYAGGSPKEHLACFANQVTSGLLATMLALTGPGENILSIVPNGHSHPSVRSAVSTAGAVCIEVVGLDAAAKGLQALRPAIAVITTVTPQKYVFSVDEIRTLINLAKDVGARVVIDDAHGALRMAYFDQPPILQLGEVDVAVNSMDKHLDGPRAALVVGAISSVERVRDRIYELGLPAQFPNYVASLRALESYDPEKIKAAGVLAQKVMEELGRTVGIRTVYQAGAGVAFTDRALSEIVANRAGAGGLALVPVEVSSLISMRALDAAGLMLIQTIAMPGASPGLRIMMYPDGERAGADRIIAGLDEAIDFAARSQGDESFCRRYICG